MRRSTDRRLARLIAAALVVLAGCDNKPKGTGAAGGGTRAGGGTEMQPAQADQTPKQAADAFLVALGKGEATPDHLTPAFRKVIGRSDAEAREWLDRARGLTFRPGEDATFGTTVMVRGRAEGPAKGPGPTGFALRMVQQGSGFQADWLQFSEQTKFGVRLPSDRDLAAAVDSVRNFLDLCIGNDYRPAQALLAPALRKSVSPLPPAVQPKDGTDYDPGFLVQAMRAWLADVRGYTLAKTDLGQTKDAATVVVDLEVDGQKRPATVKLTCDPATGWWLISEFTK